ncbi:hypothetical protein GCM10029978_052740 [Actinoallomurus acanthiterrae]
MGVSGRRRSVISPVAVAAVPIAIGLVGNLATSTVEVKAGWWVPLTWTVTGLLVVVAVVSQVVQSRTVEDEPRSQWQAPPSSPVTVEHCDPIVLGVHPAIALDERAAASGISPKLPTYVDRDHDRLLRQAIGDPAAPVFVMLVGSSSTGKTRSAYEAVRSRLPGWRLVHPLTASELITSVEAGIGPRTVLWLNESQTYLGGRDGEAAAAAVRRLLSSTVQVVVIGSMWPHYWFACTRTPLQGAPDPHRQVRFLMETATKISVPDAFTPSDLAGAERLAKRDPRLASALTGLAHGYGVTQTLAGGPDLVSRWENAPDPYSRAVIHAAVDARRLGHFAPLPAELLRALSASSLTGPQLAAASADWFDNALAYACETVRGEVSLLTPTSRVEGRIEGYLLADFIDQHGRNARRCAPVTDGAWQALAAYATDPDDLERMGTSALARARYVQALALWRAALERGAVSAIAPLHRLLTQMGRRQETEKVLRIGTDAGDAESQGLLLAMLRRENRGREIEEVLRRAVAAGDRQAGRDLAVLLHNNGRENEAEGVLRAAADQGDRTADRLLAILLRRSGKTAEAVQVRRRLDIEPALLPSLRPSDRPERRTSDGETRSTTAFPEVMAELRILVRMRVGRAREERLLRQVSVRRLNMGRLSAGPSRRRDPELHTLLGTPSLRDRALRALDAVRAGPEKDPDLARLLANLLIKANRRTEAEEVLRRAADVDHQALTELVELLTKSGKRAECVPLLRAAMDTHGGKARYLLAEVQLALGEVEEADRLLRSAADDGIDAAIELLVRRSLAAGRVQQALETTERASRAGRSDSVRRAAVQLYKAGHEEETLRLLRGEIVCGSAETLSLLIFLLERMGRTEEAVAVTRRGLTADGSTAPGPVAGR